MSGRVVVKSFLVAILYLVSIQFAAQIIGEGWVRIGICYSGDITALAVSPDYESDKTVYVATASGGLWVSNDRGENWQLCEAIPCDEVVTSIALPKNYFYNTGKPSFAVTQNGHFFSSVDDFNSVKYFYDFDPGQAGYFCTGIVAGGLTAFDNNLYVGTLGAGVFWNGTGGEGAWTNITYGQEGLLDCSSLELTSESPQQLWASALAASKPYVPIYRLSGSSWIGYASALNGVDVLDLHIPWGYPQYIYAATRTKGMWYSSNTGSTWSVACDGTTTGPTSFEVQSVATCPSFGTDQELWEGRSDGLRLSTDRGITCNSYLINSSIKEIEFTQGYHTGGNFCDAFVGTNTGLYRINCSEGRVAKSPIDADGYAVAMANQNKGAFVGSMALGLLKSTGNDTLIQYNNFPNEKIPQIVAIGLPNSYYEGGTCGDEGTIFVAANFIDSPSDNGVYRSIDFGNSWIKIVGGTGSEWPTTDVYMVDLVVSPNFRYDETLYAATTTRLFRWNDSTEVWIEVGKDPTFDEIDFIALPTQYYFGTTCSYGGFSGAPCNMILVGGKPSGFTRSYLNVSYNNGATFSVKTLFPEATGITFPENYCYGSNTTSVCFISSSTNGVMMTNAVDFSNRTYKNGGLPTNRYVVDITSDPDWIDATPTPAEANLLCAVAEGDGSLSAGIYKSVNYGSWSLVRSGHALSVAFENYVSGNSHDLAIAGFKRDPVFGINPPYGAYYSSNSGDTFSRYRGYWSLPEDVFSSVAHERNPNYIFASSPSMGVFVSKDKGESFRPFNVGKGGTEGPCRLKTGYGITMLADRRGTDLDVIYVGTTDGIKSRYIHYDSSTGEIRLNYETSGTSNPSGWRHSKLPGGGNTTGYWERLEVVPNSSQNYPIWAVSPDRGAYPGQGFATLPAGSYEGWIFQNDGLPSNPNAKGVRVGFSSGSGIQPLISGAPIKESVKQGEWDYYSIEVPNSATDLRVFLDDPDDYGAQDADLYVRYGALPTTSTYDYRPYTNGDEDVCIKSILFENFEGSWGPYGDNPPAGWEILDFGDENPKVWNTNDWYKYSNGSYGNSARVYYSPLENQIDELRSPSFNIPTGLIEATLEFDHYFRNYSTGEHGRVLFISDQTTWVTLADYTTSTSGMVHATLDLTSYIGNTNCRIVFQYEAYNGWYWIVDNVRVTGKSPQKLTAGTWYIGIRGYAGTENGYTLNATIDSGCIGSYANLPSGTGKDPKYANYVPPEPKAPVAGTTWGTVNGSGVWRGSGTPSFAESTPQPQVVTWLQRNGATPNYLGNLNTKTIIQLPDTTLVVGCDASSTLDRGIFYSPAGDEGATQWYEAHSVAGTSSKDYVDIIQSSNGDVLIAANGTGATPGGVWLSGDKGRNWMNISYGFDSSSQELQDIVADSGDPVSYYASTDETGLWTRTITASAYPTITNINPNNGSDQGGTPVTITGTGFSNSCPTGTASNCPSSSPIVIFGSNDGTTAYEVVGTYVSPTQITATTPAHPAGSVSVKVRNPDTRQTSSGVTFTFNFTCLSPSGFANNTAIDLNGCNDEGVKIDWSAPSEWGDGGSGTRTYDVLRNGSVIQSGLPVSTLTYTDTTGTNGTTYNYQVRANNGCGQSTATTGASAADAVNPGAPTITAVNDVNGCAQNGVQVIYTGGSGATSHNLYRDGSLVLTDYTSGTTYDPGDTLSHKYVVRGINGTCYSDSNEMSAADANGTPSMPSISSIVDNDPLNLTGITISYTSGTPATGHDLYRDSVLVQEGFSSGSTYYPGDSSSHNYTIRAINGVCYSESAAVSGQDETATVPPPEIATGSSYPDDAQWWSGNIQNWPTSVSASGYKLYRLEKSDLPNLLNASDEGCYRDTGSSNSYDCSGDEPSGVEGRVYYYLVTGYNGAGEGSAGSGRVLSSSTVCSP